MKEVPPMKIPQLLPARGERALTDLVRFFVLLLVFTLLARGMSGAVMPVVTVQKPTRGNVTRALNVGATVSAAEGEPFTLPQGILVLSAPVQSGQTVKAGDPLAVLEKGELERMIAAKEAELQKLRVQIGQLCEHGEADGFAAVQAQKQLERSYAEAREIWDKGVQKLQKAEQELAEAQRKLNDAKNREAATPEQAQKEAEILEAEAAVAMAEEALEAQREAVENANKAANAAALAGEDTRDAALHSYEKEAETLRKAAALDQADAGILRAEAALLEAELESLREAAQNGGVCPAPFDGTVVSLAACVGQPSPAVGGILARSGSACELTAGLQEEQAELLTVGETVEAVQGSSKGQAQILSLSAPDSEGIVTMKALLPQGNWKPGPASVKGTLRGGEQGCVLPASAINQDAEGNFVLAVEEQSTVLGQQNLLVRLPVNVVERGDTSVAVTGALDGTTRIVSGADRPVRAGDRVRIHA